MINRPVGNREKVRQSKDEKNRMGEGDKKRKRGNKNPKRGHTNKVVPPKYKYSMSLLDLFHPFPPKQW